MTTVKIRAGSATEVMHTERRVATEELARELRGLGLDVELELIEYVPGRRGLTLVEWTSLFIGTNVASGLIGNMTKDLYDGAKRMVQRRRSAKLEKDGHAGRPLGFVIYGPDGEELSRWNSTDEDGNEIGDR